MKNKIIKLLKWLAIFIISGIILLFISIYISSLNSYKESDFNIPKDFFNTKYHDKDENSENNGFNDLVDFSNNDDEKPYFIWYYDKKSKCLFDEKYKDSKRKCSEEELEKLLFKDYNKKVLNNIKKSKFKNIFEIKKYVFGVDEWSDRILNKNLNKVFKKEFFDFITEEENINNKKFIKKISFLELKGYIFKNKKILVNITNKEFIKQTKDYLGVNGKAIYFTNLIQYFRVSRLLIDNYINNGKEKLAIKILIDNQKIADYFINNSDVNLISNLAFMSIENTNLNTIKYFLKNYDLDEESKNELKLVLEKKLYNGLIENGVKYEYIIQKELFKMLGLKNFDLKIFIKSFSAPLEVYDYIGPISIIKNTLFFSETESILLSKKLNYEIIKNKGDTDFKVDLNLNNYGGREFINIGTSNFINQFKKEQDLHKLRQEIFDSLN